MTDTQNTAPERIWLQLGAGDYGTHTWCDQPQDWADENGEGEPEYIRADLHERLLAEAYRSGMLRAHDALIVVPAASREQEQAIQMCQAAIRAEAEGDG